MANKPLHTLSIKEASERIRTRTISVVELVDSLLERIESVNPRINAFVTVLKEESRREAKRLDEEISSGNYRGPLHGIPLALKDIIDVKGVPTTASSKILLDNIAEQDARVVELLKKAGAIIIGKNNLHEFAYGASNEDSYFGPCRNPWSLRAVSGGSSGGSAAAVAASTCFGALGTDTGGSIRIPSSLCGVVGLKPTFGSVSTVGVFPVSWSLDCVGPIARTVGDVAIVFDAIRERDLQDRNIGGRISSSLVDSLSPNVDGVKAAVLRKYLEECVSDDVRRKVEVAVRSLEKMGIQVEELLIPNIEKTASVTDLLMACETTTIHEKWLKTRVEDYTPSVRTRLETGYFYLATHYVKALQLRKWFGREFAKALKKIDVILSPTCPITPFEVGQKTIDVNGVETDPRPFLAMFTKIHSLTGYPAVTVPCGFTSDGLPIGLQISGRPFDEQTVLRVASAYESGQPWKNIYPLL